MNVCATHKILMTVDAVGGVWSYALELLKGLVDYEIILVGLGPEPSSEKLKDLSRLPHVNWLYRPYALEWMDNSNAEVAQTGEWLLELQDQFNPDLVHLNGFAHAGLNWKIPVLVVAHSSVCTWWPAVHGTPIPSRFSEYQEHIARALEAADLVVAPSRMLLNALAEEYGSFANCEVIPNGHSIAARKKPKKKAQIASAGRIWDEAKNIALLDRIAPSLKWPVYLAGETMPNKKSAVCEHVRLLGPLNSTQMNRLFEASEIYAAPALYEPFGLAILEAATHGCALVLADIPSLRENWNGAALFLDPRDEKSWICALNNLSDDTAERTRLSRLAIERSRDFTAGKMVAAYRRIYSQLVHENSSANQRRLPVEPMQTLIEEMG